MQWPINNIDPKEINIYGSILETMIYNLSYIGGSDIVLPFVDNSSIRTIEEQNFISSFLEEFEKLCRNLKINLALETDLEPTQFSKLISKISNSRVTINYDSGNSASLGYSFVKEIELYGEKISNIHIKDRKKNSGPVMLGKGDAELLKVKDFIMSEHYNGLVIFQAFRDNNPINTFKKQLNFFNNL